MTRSNYVVTYQAWDDWHDGRAPVKEVSEHTTVSAANVAAEESVEEHCMFSWFPDRVKRIHTVNAHGGHEYTCEMSKVEARTQFRVKVEKRATATPIPPTKSSKRVLTKTDKGFMIALPLGKPNGLVNGQQCAKFTLCGDLDTMTRPLAAHAVEVYGGRNVNTFTYADYAVRGKNSYADELRALREEGAEIIDEEGFYKLLKDGVPKDKVLKNVSFDRHGHIVSDDQLARDAEGDVEPGETHGSAEIAISEGARRPADDIDENEPPAKKQRTDVP